MIAKDTIKDLEKPPGEEVQRVSSGKVLSAGASVSMELGCITLPHEDVFTKLKPSKPHNLGILMEALSCRHDGLLTQFTAPPLLQRMGVD